MKIQQRVADGLRDERPHGALVMKLHLALGRMDVHVHLRGVEFKKETAHRVAAFHQRGVVALDEREVERAVLDGPAVDEEMLIVTAATRDAGCADEAPQAELRVGS